METPAVAYLVWSDLVGVARTRGVPARDLERRWESGLGWAMAGQALDPFTGIADNPWGPMDEARQVPDPQARFHFAGDGQNRACEAVICDSLTGDGRPWEACVRSLYRAALDDLKAATGLGFMASWEHEFMVSGDDRAPETPFSFAAARERHALLVEIDRLLSGAGIVVETLEPEFGLAQYEVSCAPVAGVAAADWAIVAREAIREAARRLGLRATFTPKLAPDAVGSGAHVHFSFIGEGGRNATYEPGETLGLSPVAQRFCAGVLAHVDALCAITAPSPVSYWRLGPHHWSCGFRAIGLQNREATLRVTPGVSRDPERRRKGFNVEYRPIDATASPYLALAMIIRAGLDGLTRDLALPAALDRDPADLSEAERQALDVTPLPARLEAALDALEADRQARSWLPPAVLEVYLKLKRGQCKQAAEMAEADLFAAYARAY